MPDLIQKAFQELYPEKQFMYNAILSYSGKFNNFNGNVRLAGNKIEVGLSKEWEQVSEEIQIGMIQSLLVKIFRRRGEKYRKTTNMDLYNMFLKNVHIALPKEAHPALLQLFQKLNEQYFNGVLEQPSLQWGSFSKRKLGSYEYGSDTIVLSKYLENAPQEYLEYVLYHEMLHKKHKFSHNGSRALHHSTAFKADESQFPQAAQLEKEIPRYLARKRMPYKRQEQPTFQSLIRNFFQ